MSREPIVEGIVFDVAGGVYLSLKPTAFLVVVNVHGDVVGLGNPHKPMALNDSRAQNKRVSWLVICSEEKCRDSVFRLRICVHNYIIMCSD